MPYIRLSTITAQMSDQAQSNPNVRLSAVEAQLQQTEHNQSPNVRLSAVEAQLQQTEHNQIQMSG